MKKRLLSFLIALALMFTTVIGTFPAAKAASITMQDCADTLYTLGLFKGVGSNPNGSPDYDLDRAPTRSEAGVMLVRLLGMESKVLRWNYPHPFKDVESWAKPYVGFLYSWRLSNGTSDTTYGSNDSISSAQFITLVLRALGYISGSDFQWDQSYIFSDSIGLTDGSYKADSSFTRGDAAIILYSALKQKIDGSSVSLLTHLNSAGALKAGSLEATGLNSLLPQTPPFPKTEVSYAVDASAPDFGAYFGITPMNKDKMNLPDNQVGLKYLYPQVDVNLVDANAVTDYVDLLRKWNFSFKSSVNKGSYTEDTYENGNVQVIITTSLFSIPNYYSILMIYTKPAPAYNKIEAAPDFGTFYKTAPSYKEIEAVPDFGTFYGITLVSSDIKADTDTKTSFYSFRYSKSELGETGVSGYYKYNELLKSLGFATGKKYNNFNFRQGTYYIKDNLAVVVIDSTLNYWIDVEIIAAESGKSILTCPAYTNNEVGCFFDTTVPDFATYFGLSTFGGSSSLNRYAAYFDYNEAMSKNPNIMNDYAALLKKWGFSFISTKTIEGSVSDIYQKSSSNRYYNLPVFPQREKGDYDRS